MNVYEKSPVPFIKPICIDNKNIRLELLKSSRLNVKTVPCVLLSYPNKTYEKFEGTNICQWLIEQITENSSDPPQSLPQQQLQQQPIQSLQQQPIPSLQQQPIQQRRKSAVDIAADMQKEREQMLPNRPDPKLQQQVLMGQQSRFAHEQNSQQHMSQRPLSMSEMAMNMQKERENMFPVSNNPNIPQQTQMIVPTVLSNPTSGRAAAEQAVAMQQEREQMEQSLLTNRPLY
ncbi:hypothetical protein OAV62_01620 [bacterium]|nr:hypothetical protein [bacterium]